MKEIKFRAWDKTTNKMKEVLGIIFSRKLIALKESKYTMCYANLFEIKLMQYTGFKDNNGKEIYEGDIIQFLWCEDSCWGEAGTYKGYVRFNEGIFEVVYIDRKDITKYDDGSWRENSKADDIRSLFSWSEEIEVIGNVYDDKNLLGDQVEELA